MAVGKILVNGEGLRSISGKLYSIINSIEGIEQTLLRLTSETENRWKGKAPSEAKADFKQIIKRSSSLREQLTKRAQSIEEVLERYESTEQTNVSQVSSLSVVNIF